MPKLPPPAVVAVTEVARSGLDTIKRNLVPAPFALLDLINDFWAFHVAFTLAELRVPDAMREGPRAAEALARELNLDADLLYRVLRASTMLGLCEELPNRTFALKPMGRALCADPQASFRDFIIYMGRHGTRLWRRLPDCVRQGKTAVELETGKRSFEYLAGDPEVAVDFNRAMTAVSNIACEGFVASYDMKWASKVVDIGGGHGRLLGGILQQAPAAKGVLFDMPSVIAGAAETLDALGVRPRVEIVAGNFFESVPEGADCYVAKSVIHDWSDADANKILSNIRRAMAPNGRVLLFEAIVGPRNNASFAKLLDLEMIIAAGGRERTQEEFRALLSGVGLRVERFVPTPGPMAIVEAFAV